MRVVHGKRVNGTWRDFVFLDGTGSWRGSTTTSDSDRAMYSDLRFFGGRLTQMEPHVNRIFRETLAQHRSPQPLMLIYADVNAHSSNMVETDPNDAARYDGGLYVQTGPVPPGGYSGT